MEDAGLIACELYEAALDDELFAALPHVLARHFTVRSAVIHWLDRADRSEVDATCGYFSAEQMQTYAEHFAASDLWTVAAARDACRNTAWRASDLVAESDYAASAFYNEWIRPMGDDTWRCAGAVMETPRGFGIIGLHRGRTQPDFATETIGRLQQAVPHLRRALSIRARLIAHDRAVESWVQVFETGRLPAMLLDAQGRVRRINHAADRLLERATIVRQHQRRIVPCRSQQLPAWLKLVRGATDAAAPCARQAAFGDALEGVWLAEALPIVSGELAGCALVTISDRSSGSRNSGLCDRLQELYRLTGAEAAVAVSLTEGHSLAEIAAARGTSLETVRSQLKQVLAKTGTRRQGEMVSMALQLASG